MSEPVVPPALRKAFAPCAAFARSLARMLRRFTDEVHRMKAPRLFGRSYRQHRRKCPVCNPAGFGRPLAIDGREYHRRLRARRRRAR